MEGSGELQVNSPQVELANSQRQDDFLNIECERDWAEYQEGSVRTTHTSKSHSRRGSHISQRRDDNKAMQKEIDDLKKKLRHAQWKRSPSSFGGSSSGEDDASYRRRSRTPPSESFSCDEEPHYRQKYSSPPCKGIGNDVMNKALNPVSKSPFTRRIEGAKLPRCFHKPTFLLYNGWSDPVEHVSQFNQRMAVHLKDEALLCKIFPSFLRPVAMRWFNGLRANSRNSFRELTQSFGSRFVTCNRVPRPLDSLLSLSMREGENLKAYSDRY